MPLLIELPKYRNERLELPSQAKSVKTRRLMGPDQGLASQDALGRVFGRAWNRTILFSEFEPGPLAGYPDPFPPSTFT
jgi:hypothetical protein